MLFLSSAMSFDCTDLQCMCTIYFHDFYIGETVFPPRITNFHYSSDNYVNYVSMTFTDVLPNNHFCAFLSDVNFCLHVVLHLKHHYQDRNSFQYPVVFLQHINSILFFLNYK